MTTISVETSKYRLVPENCTISVYLTVKPGSGLEAIAFYKKLFGATELYKLEAGGKVYHCQLQIGTSVIMLGDSDDPKYKLITNPNLLISMYVDDVDKLVRQSVGMGCLLERPIQDEWWGDRMGTIVDPYGIRWGLATHINNLSSEEIRSRFNSIHKKSATDKNDMYLKKILKYQRKMDKLSARNNQSN